METVELVEKIGKYYGEMCNFTPQTKNEILQHFLGLIVIYKLHMNPEDKIIDDVKKILEQDFGPATEEDKTEYFRITKEMYSHTNDNLAFWKSQRNISKIDTNKIHLAYCRQLYYFALTFSSFTLSL